MTTIRKASTADLPWIMIELQKFSTFFGTKKPLFSDDLDYQKAFLTNVIENHVFFMAEDEGVLQGLIAGFIVPHFLNPEIRLMSELFWWVSEEHRGSRAALMLLNAYTEHGKANADWVTFSLEHHSPVSDKTILKRGFKPQERSFLMEI